MAKGKKNFIKGAIKRPGAFTKAAKKAGKSIAEYARDVTKKGSHAGSRLQKEAVLAKTLRKIAKKRKRRK